MSKKNLMIILFTAIPIIILGMFLLFGDKSIYSDTERRKLEELPEINLTEILSGDYMSDFEKASTDHFPLRDIFRKIKAYTVTGALGQLDNNKIFRYNKHISKLEYPLKKDMLDHASECFENIYTDYFSGTDANVYFSVVPDKNMYLIKESSYPSIDYENLFSYMREKTDYMTYIDIKDFLSADDYYFTDTHWKQERITDIAKFIAEKMNVQLHDDYVLKTANENFYGVYYGQSALCSAPDKLNYLTNNLLENCIVTIYPNGKAEKTTVYSMEKAYSKDPYEMFLSGNQPIVEIENSQNKNGKKLIIFRDSFGSSLAPLLISGYSKITLIDTRYIQPSMLGNFIDADTDDVLFIYSTLVLNSSLAIRQ